MFTSIHLTRYALCTGTSPFVLVECSGIGEGDDRCIQMLEASHARWLILKPHHVLLILCTLLIARGTNAQLNNIDVARGISASLKFHHTSKSPSEEAQPDFIPYDDQGIVAADSSGSAYFALEDNLFFNKEKRNVESSKACTTPQWWPITFHTELSPCFVSRIFIPGVSSFCRRRAGVAGIVQRAGPLSWTW